MQFTTYKEMKERFSNHLWLDVVSKCDLLQVSPASNLQDDMEKYKSFGPEGAIRVSVKSEFGLPEVGWTYLQHNIVIVVDNLLLFF